MDVSSLTWATLRSGPFFPQLTQPARAHDRLADPSLSFRYTQVVHATPFPTFRFAIEPDDIQVSAAALEDVGQLDREVDQSKLVVTPWNTGLVVTP